MNKTDVYEIEFKGMPHESEVCSVGHMDKYLYGGIQTIPRSMKVFICFNNFYTHKWSHYRVIPESVGQNTRLKTNSGIFIFTGDIIKSPKGNMHVIRYDKLTASYVAEFIPYNEINPHSSITQEWITRWGKEVIGTEYNNPELLNKEKQYV